MRRLTVYFLTFCALLASAGLLASSVEAKKHPKKHKHAAKKSLQIVISGCQQSHTARAAQSGGLDAVEVILRILGGGGLPRSASAPQPVAGATVSATLTGPYVKPGAGSDTGKTDAQGSVHLTLKFTGPGMYTVSITAMKAGATTAKLTKTINVTGPMNAACALA